MKLRFGFKRLPSMLGVKRVPLFKTHGKEATIVVAAWNTKNRARADYLAPKEDALDYITQFIIPKLPSNGGSITLLEGSFEGSTEDKPLKISSKSNIKIQGQGKATELHLGTGISSNLIEIENSNAILIESMYLNGETSYVEDDENNLKRNGILLNNVTYSKIRDVWVNNCKRQGINLWSSERNEVIGCSGLDNEQNGIHLENASHNTVSGNTLNENGSEGIYLYTSCGNTIAGNTCEKNNYNGIHMVAHSDNNTISGNTCNDSVIYHGIWLDGSFKCTITGNTCDGNGSNGIALKSLTKRATISGNSCSGNTKEGIEISIASYNVVLGNTIQENGFNGIKILHESHNNGVLSNIIYDNGQGAAGGSVSYDGINISDDCDSNNLQGNTIRKEGTVQTHRYGINIADSDCDLNLVTNNDLKDSGVTGDLNDNGTNTKTAAGNRT
jgi:parallel beta-helix repeat protein